MRTSPQLAWEVRKVAQQLSVSAVYLRRMVKNLAGDPPRRFVTEHRLMQLWRNYKARHTDQSTVSGVGFHDLPPSGCRTFSPL
jgi:AraC-like DNA-binding protein